VSDKGDGRCGGKESLMISDELKWVSGYDEGRVRINNAEDDDACCSLRRLYLGRWTMVHNCRCQTPVVRAG
jgi:hypothetical protein